MPLATAMLSCIAVAGVLVLMMLWLGPETRGKALTVREVASSLQERGRWSSLRCWSALLLRVSGLPRRRPPTAPAASGPPVRVLMLTATAGFRHDSIATASR